MELLTISELRRCLRDLFAIATLPAVWAGADARKIAQTLGDALAQALDADVVCVFVDEVVEGHLDIRLPDAGEHARGEAQRFLRGLITAGPGSCTCELFGVTLKRVRQHDRSPREARRRRRRCPAGGLSERNRTSAAACRCQSSISRAGDGRLRR